MIVEAAKIIGSGLATIGLKDILLSIIKSDDKLISKIIYTKLINEAISTVDNMLNSLPKDSVLLKFLEKEILSSKLEILGKKNENNELVIDKLILLTSNLSYKKVNKTNLDFYLAGVYLFKAPDGKQYLGSCMDFYARLMEHKARFKYKQEVSKLYSYKYKFEDYKWGPIYKTINYYKKFVYIHPDYVLSSGEIDILYAITQLIPRVLEQSLLLHFTFALNNESKLILFSYTSWNSNNLFTPLLENKRGKQVQIIINSKVIMTVYSIRMLMEVLGIKSRETIVRYINHVRTFYSPKLKNYVNIKYPYVSIENLLTHNIIHRKNINVPELIIPNISLFSLTLNKLYVYNSDLSLIKTYESIKKAVRNLNPNHEKLGISLIGREIAIARYKNKKFLVKNEIGSFYFAENPNSNRWATYNQKQYPLILKDIINGTELKFTGINAARKYLADILKIKPSYKTIKSYSIKGIIYRERFMFILTNKKN